MHIVADSRAQLAVLVPVAHDFLCSKQGGRSIALRCLCVYRVERLQRAHVDQRIASDGVNRTSGVATAKYAHCGLNA